MPGSPYIDNKIDEARFFFGKLQEADENSSLSSREFGYYLSAFRSACGSVKLIGVHEYEKAGRDGQAWWNGQLAQLSQHERDLVEYFRVERNIELHRGYSAHGTGIEERPAVAALSRGKGTTPVPPFAYDEGATIGVQTHYLTMKKGDDRHAVRTCAEYLRVLSTIAANYSKP